MIQCKYCGSTAEWPIDVKHRDGCIIAPNTYVIECFQEVEEKKFHTQLAGGDNAGNTWWECGKHGTKGGTHTGILVCPKCWPEEHLNITKPHGGGGGNPSFNMKPGEVSAAQPGGGGGGPGWSNGVLNGTTGQGSFPHYCPETFSRERRSGKDRRIRILAEHPEFNAALSSTWAGLPPGNVSYIKNGNELRSHGDRRSGKDRRK